jgi:hypothetical protein
MNNKKIVKTVPLAPNESERAYKERKQLDCIQETLADLFMEICEKKAEKEEAFWEAIRSRIQPEPHQSLRVNWITSEIEVLEDN